MRFMLSALMILVLLLTATLIVMGQSAPGDIVFSRKDGGGGTPPAVFPHWFHRIRFKCYVCHDAIFQMKQGANKVTMDAIMKGEYCGRCHNGDIAWSVAFETCNRCHVQR